MIRKSESVS